MPTNPPTPQALRDVFSGDPERFLDTPARLEALLLMLGDQRDDADMPFALARWEDLTGLPCPSQLHALMTAYANTGAVNTALASQGSNLVVAPAGYGDLLSLELHDDEEITWEGSFALGLTFDPGDEHATLLRDLCWNWTSLGGDPYAFYELGEGHVFPQTASSLAAMVYACALRAANWDAGFGGDDYLDATGRVLPFLIDEQDPAETLLETAEASDLEVPNHDPSWEPQWNEMPGVSNHGVPHREWLVQMVSVLQHGGVDEVDESMLARLRELCRVASPPPANQDSAADCIYAGMFCFCLAPDGLAGWAEQAREHRSLLVQDAAQTLLAGSHDVLVALRTLGAKAQSSTSDEDVDLQSTAIDMGMIWAYGRD